MLVAAASAAVALSGCGESKEEKALAAVCTAKDDIGKQVTTLKSITPATFSLSKVQTSVKAINDDLSTISDQLPTLKNELQPQLQQANQEFKGELTNIAAGLFKSISADEGKEAASQAALQLEAAYKKAFSSLECPDAAG